ncbi:MAG TPA: flagellin [Terracidiphilus sp.]|nr:flagellin [Terracidiphilus sp.]
MSLGVLNNLSAVYAENNLNSTNNSLNTVLQQLSSGSQINSGADDAAGLSLVDGLQANQMALNQSETNSTEGVGLLQVADGALSQVTSLLNRAVTLATEASNGTLNTSQDAAANQEYQSILSEIDNIGSTTTYNQETVFGNTFNIYTGDSTAQGASIDALNITGLSSANVGATAGTMSYSTGTSEFIDLGVGGGGTGNAQSTDDVTGSLDFTTGIANDGGTIVDSTATVATPDAGTTAESISSFISSINGSGLGVTASFATEGGDTGILITGNFNDTTSDAIPPVTTYDQTPAAVGQVMVEQGANDPALTDTSTGASPATPTGESSGTATISYTASAGQNLSGTDLSNSADAQTALTDLNSSIADVAAQDGYVGAQINTLNAVSSVLSTQSENVQSAQNAVQATDYASATSNMSKYEILSQTGIAALAQANSQQQDVLKLLQ